MRDVWLGMVLVSFSLLAGVGHAQTCSFQFRAPLGVPVADRPALPVPIAMNTAQPMPGPTCQASTWVSATMPAGVTVMYDIAYGNGLFVAVSGGFTGQARVITSVDGINWTSSSTPVPNHTGFDDIAFGNGLFVGSNALGGSRVMYSTDGVNWTLGTGSTANWSDVQYANGVFMIASDNSGGNRIRTSTDAVNWPQQTDVPVSSTRALVYGNGRWLAVSSGTGSPVRAAYSTDNGITWVPSTTDLSSFRLNAVAFGAGKFLAVGDSGAALTSVDGATWTVVSTTLARNWRAAAYGHGRFVIGSDNSIARTLMTSIDGITWTDVTASSGLPNIIINSIIAGPDRFYLAAQNSRGIWYSTN